MNQKGTATAARRRKPVPQNESLGHFVFWRRRELELSQAELSELSGVGVTTISVLENDKAPVSLATLRLLAVALDVDVDDLTALAGL